MRLPLRIVSVLLLAFPVAAVATASPYLVKDLKTGLDPSGSSFPRPSFYGYAALQNRVVFFGLLPEEIFSDSGQPQCWLWSSDGTPGGTTRLIDLCAQLEDPDELRFGFQMVASNGAVAFFADLGSRLWRTDGTGPGTYPLGPDLSPFGHPAIGPGGILFFAGCTPAGGCHPWRSDGTRRGTRQLLDGPYSARTFLSDGNRMLFTAAGGLWTTDGTRAGTNLLVQVAAGTAGMGEPIRRGDKIYFVASPSAADDVWVYDLSTRKAVRLRSSPIDYDREGGAALDLAAGRVLIRDDGEDGRSVLWETDGTRAGTRPLGPPFQFAWISPIREAGGRAVFAAIRPSSTGTPQPARLWSLSPGAKRPVLLTGCPEGCPEVVLVQVGCHLCQEYYSDLIPSLTLGGRFYFVGKDAQHGQELWSTDGTGPGTHLVKDLCPGDCDGAPFRMTAVAGRLLLVDRQGGVWISDGTPGGTVRLGTTYAPGGPGQPPDLAVLGGRIFFTGFDEANGFQPWRSDLTPAGTGPADVIGSSLAASSWPYALTPLGSRVLFQACDNSAGGLWASDGTEAGTVQLPGSDVPCPQGSRYGSLFIPVGDIAFYVWKDELWATDGTAAGTRDLLDLSPYWLTDSASAPLGNGLLFALLRSSSDPTNGWEWTFWSSDGTPQGTRALFPFRFGGNPREFTAGGGLVYFYAQAAETPFPMQLWRTDGTEAGTYPLLSDTGSSGIPMVRLGGRTYFIAGQRPVGYELWSTDGTVAGTAPVVPSLTGERPRSPVGDLWSLTVFQGALWFFAQTSEDGQPWALWRSDGTAGGTRAVKLLAAVADPATGYVKPFEPTVLGDQLFFRLDDGVHGLELWKTDGTAAGTVLVKDVNPGPASSHIDHLTAAAGRLYFAATDGEHGYELWESDGTETGTRMVMDILPGFASSNPAQLTPAGGRLFFDADDGEHGLELWALPLP